LHSYLFCEKITSCDCEIKLRSVFDFIEKDSEISGKLDGLDEVFNLPNLLYKIVAIYINIITLDDFCKMK
jgi:hypothetical protein